MIDKNVLSHLPFEPEFLIEQAIQAASKAYAPYSNFHVGCVLIDQDDQLHHGCNIENAAYGPTNCAERTALFRAIADGHAPLSFRAMAVVGDSVDPISPCGVCRQVMVELCRPEMPVVLANKQGKYTITTVGDLLPGAFTSQFLEEDL